MTENDRLCVTELDRRADEVWAGEGLSFEEWAAEDE
jgi:hypothetical protein